MKKRYHTLGNAHDAWWFLHYHPKLQLRERVEIKPKDADKMEAEGYIITRDTGGKCYKEYRHTFRHAVAHNLDIHYTYVNDKGYIDDDGKKNVNVECWLEFGPEEYMYWYGTDGNNDWDTETARMNTHDPRLDCGGASFDEALVRLAKLVRKHYGDYNPDKPCRCPRTNKACVECRELRRWMKKQGLEGKKKKPVLS